MVEKTILLDLDGVVADFHKEAFKRRGKNFYEMEREGYDFSNWNIWADLGLTESDFYGWLEQEGANFWASLEFTPYGLELYNFCKARAKTYFVTAPTLDSDSAKGKVQWIRRHFGRFFNMYVITPHKHLLAKPNTILIDDSDTNIKKFSAAGGKTILFPRQWNENRDNYSIALQYTQMLLIQNLSAMDVESNDRI